MTKNPPKKAAEGPFRKVDRVLFGARVYDVEFGPEDVPLSFVVKYGWANELNIGLAKWLKSQSGKRWMEENGVGLYMGGRK